MILQKLITKINRRNLSIFCISILLFGCKDNGRQNIAATSAVSELPSEVNCCFTDEQLVDSMIVFCSYQFSDMDAERLDIIYKYYTECSNEDASEGIYYRTAEALVSNNQFLDQITQYAVNKGENYDSEFVNSLFLCLMSLNDIWGPSTDQLRKLIPEKFINTFYKSQDGSQYLQRLLDYYSQEASY